MREYELTVVYDLSVAEAGGPDAGPQRITTMIEGRGGKMLKVDHWGRRRMAYPIGKAIDGDYIVTRVELDPTTIAALEAALKIDERCFRHLVVRADELPPPPPPREPREPRPEMRSDAPAASEAPAAEAVTAEVATVAEEAEAPAATPITEEAPAAAEAPPAEAEPMDVAVATAVAEADPEPTAVEVEPAAAVAPEAATEPEASQEPEE
jgi:small subunit ribosomal protein S6